jgi:glutaryl-CoA dehydrogenase
VPETSRLPGATSFRAVAEQLNNARSDVAWEAVGITMGAYENALRYANARVQFDRPISAFQLSQEKLVKILANITAMQTLMLQNARLQARDGQISAERASLAKFFCTERMRESVALARELLGGNGILLEHNVARFFADAEAVYSYEGSRDMQLLIVGKAITGHSAFA